MQVGNDGIVQQPNPHLQPRRGQRCDLRGHPREHHRGLSHPRTRQCCRWYVMVTMVKNGWCFLLPFHNLRMSTGLFVGGLTVRHDHGLPSWCAHPSSRCHHHTRVLAHVHLIPSSLHTHMHVGPVKPSSPRDLHVDSLDFSAKILHSAWHPKRGILALAATNNLYLFRQ